MNNCIIVIRKDRYRRIGKKDRGRRIGIGGLWKKDRGKKDLGHRKPTMRKPASISYLLGRGGWVPR